MKNLSTSPYLRLQVAVLGLLGALLARLARPSRPTRRDDRGDVPGWVLVTVVRRH